MKRPLPDSLGGMHTVNKTRHLIIVIVAVATVLGIGAVSAYASLADDATPPVTTSDAVASYWNDAVVHLNATDGDGVAYIYNSLDGGVVHLYTVGAGAAATTAPDARYAPLSAGVHKLKFWAQDVNGNVEVKNEVTFTVAKDSAKPVTTATGAIDGGWYKQSVTGVIVDLSAADGAGESGVKQISYALDGAAPTVTAAATAAATLTIDATTVNGPHALVYQATDVAGNVEVAKTLTINVDTKKPTTSAPAAASVVKGRTATLKYKVTDALPNGGKATVKIVVKSGTKAVQTVKVGKVLVNKTLYAKFGCSLARGKYKFFVYATDTAGNVQAKIGANTLTVK